MREPGLQDQKRGPTLPRSQARTLEWATEAAIAMFLLSGIKYQFTEHLSWDVTRYHALLSSQQPSSHVADPHSDIRREAIFRPERILQQNSAETHTCVISKTPESRHGYLACRISLRGFLDGRSWEVAVEAIILWNRDSFSILTHLP